MLVKTPDVSYYMVPMGLWTIAEVSIGIIVSCLPVLPKFFQHVGPKVYKTFSFGSKSGTASEQKPKFRATISRLKTHSTWEHPLARSGGKNDVSNTWIDSYSVDAQPNGEYITLDDQPTDRRILDGTSTEMLSTRRDDLEQAAWSPRPSQKA